MIHNLSSEIIVKASISPAVALDYNRGDKWEGSRWPEGKVWYKINVKTILSQVNEAISHWNQVNSPHCTFQECDDKQTDFVTFFEIPSDGKNTPSSKVGIQYGEQLIKLPSHHPTQLPLRIIDILHEMMHCVGFYHEHSRPDRYSFLRIQPELATNPDFKEEKSESIGNYDFMSIMHYGPVRGLLFENGQLKAVAGQSTTFSAGDKAAIKIVYAPLDTHHGEWHNNHPSSEGTGPRPTFCGYTEKSFKPHWSCCLSEINDSKCSVEHTGFTHAPCLLDRGCKDVTCYCGYCGNGCIHAGGTAHWSCCGKNASDPLCSNRFKKKL